jgi:hypothetical protein
MAVAARTLGYNWCGAVNVAGHAGVDDYGRQYYRPIPPSSYELTETEKQRYQGLVAETGGIYMAYDGDDFNVRYRTTNPIWTDYGSPYPPHKSVFDPVGAIYTIPQPGMGQINADHWASGSDPTADDLLHPRWTDYRQILVHYYTQIDIRDAAGSDLAPYLRWNALSLDWGTTGNRPPIMSSGETHTLSMVVQNTGKGTWYYGSAQSFAVVYHFYDPRTGATYSSGNQAVITISTAPGVERTVTVTINDVPGILEPGPYVLKLDMLRESGIPQSLEWFSDQGWPTLDLSVCLNGPCRVFLPLDMKDYTP